MADIDTTRSTTLGVGTEFGFTAGLPRDFDPSIKLLDPLDVILQGMFGADGRATLSRSPATQKKIEWQDEELLLPRSKVADAGGMDTTQQTILLPSDHERLRFQTGDVLKIEDEKLLVLSYNAADATLDVQRGFQSTTPATHALDTEILGLGAALPEGSDPKEVRALDRRELFNFTQIFGPVEVKLSGTKMATARFGVPAGAEFNKQGANRMMEQWKHREQALFYGTRWEDTTTERRTMGGLTYFITKNVDSSTTTLAFDKVVLQAEAIYKAGGMANRLLVSVTQKRKVSDFPGNVVGTASPEVRLSRSDNGRGQVVDVLDTDWGRLTVLPSRELLDSDAIMFDRSTARLRPFRPMQFVPLARTGDATRGMIVSEISFELKGDQHAARFSALT